MMPVWFWFLVAWLALIMVILATILKVGWWEPRRSRLAMADVEARAEGLATSAHLGHHTFRADEDKPVHEGPGHDDWSWPSDSVDAQRGNPRGVGRMDWPL